MGYNDRGFKGGGGSGSRNFDRPPREMHSTDASGNDLVCADCGATGFQLPFKADGERPVYCAECNKNHRPPRRENNRY
ncbi:CxxC-x17-CxxC domain-containing protein [Candidatus Undinarchaeota archaeon]